MTRLPWRRRSVGVEQDADRFTVVDTAYGLGQRVRHREYRQLADVGDPGVLAAAATGQLRSEAGSTSSGARGERPHRLSNR